MPRRKTMLHLRKYLVVFFVVLLVFIWINHRNETEEPDDSLGDLPNTSIKARQSARLFPLREQHLRALIKNSRIKLPKRNNKLQSPLGTVDNSIEKVFFQKNLVEEDIVTEELAAEDVKHKDDSTLITETEPFRSRYFVNNKKCKMPYADPFSRELLEIYTPFKFKVCDNSSDLFELNYDSKTKYYVLKVKEESLNKLKPYPKCNYREVTRRSNKSGNTNSDIHPPVYFQHECKLPQSVSGIIVECHEAQNNSNVVQQDAFSLVHVYNKTPRTDTQPFGHRPSVIILGLNSMSRMNFQRTMPKTAEFVSQLGWFEMQGYNKVGDNTVDNIIPILLGRTIHQMDEMLLNYTTSGTLDGLPWIWHEYKTAGYATALAEDVALETIFKAGFLETPVDHHIRPLFLGMLEAMNSYERFGYRYCLGRRLSISYVYDFCQQFTDRYVKELDLPAFGFFWSFTFTHDFNFGAASLDEKYVEYLRRFETNKLFEKSIVLLLSDHGARFGDLLDLSDSFLEQRLPMMHIYLPPWFRDAYPKYVEALSLNRNRLCSNFDVHHTLLHILQLNITLPKDLLAIAGCPSSQSLLHPLLEERGCEDACIGDHWCTCKDFVTQSLNGEMYYLGKLVIYHINRWMLTHKFNKFCQRLSLLDIDHAEKKMLFEEDSGKETMYGTVVVYRLRFTTLPNVGKFQTTVRFNRELKTIEHCYVPDITRLDTYFNQSVCLQDRIAKKFCFCYPKKKLNPFMMDWQKKKFSSMQSV